MLQVSAFFTAHGGGIEAVAGQLAQRLAATGIDVHWMAGGPAGEAARDGDPPGLQVTQARSIDPLERRIGLPAPLWHPVSVVALWRAARRADLVHVHDYLYMPTLLAALFALLLRRPLVVTQHIGEIPFGSPLARGLLATLNRTIGATVLCSAGQTVFVGRPVLEHFQRFVRFSRPPLLVPNGVDHARYSPSEPAAEPTVQPQGDVRLLFVGRFVEKKGLLLLRRCLQLPGAAWTFIGWGPTTPAEAPSSRALVLGRLPPASIVQHYRDADLLVLPSTGEGFPLVVQEALACGTPVLVSTEVAEAFPTRDSRCVFDVELRCADPVQALRAALSELVAQPERLRSARAAAVSLAAQWSWESCVDSYRSVYDRLVPRPPAGPDRPDR